MKNITYEVDGFVTVRIRTRVKAQSEKLTMHIIDFKEIDLESENSAWEIVCVNNDFEIEEVREV